MKDNIPNEVLVFLGDNDVELEENENGVFITPILGKVGTSKAVINNRISKLKYRYGEGIVGDIKLVTLKNTDFSLEILTPEESYGICGYDDILLVIHHPELEEKVNYKIAVQISKFWFFDLLAKVRNMTGGKLVGKFRVEYKWDKPNFIPDIEVLENDEVQEKIRLGKLLADPSKWTKTVIPGHWYILKEKWNSMSRSICLGEMNCIYNPNYGYGYFDYRSPFTHSDKLTRKPTLVFLSAGYSYDSVNLSSVSFTIDRFKNFGYPSYRDQSEMNKRPGIDMGEINLNGDSLSDLLENRPSDFWDFCSDQLDYLINIIPPEELKSRRDKLVDLLRNEVNRLQFSYGDVNIIRDRLTDLFEFTPEEAKDIIDEIWKSKN